MVAALGGRQARGRVFGGYGAAKGLGYVAGPIVGGGLVMAGGYNLLFAVMSGLALAVAGAALAVVLVRPTKVRERQTVSSLVRRLSASELAKPPGAAGRAIA